MRMLEEYKVRVDMLLSLEKAIKEARGSTELIKATTPLHELVSLLAQNGIRFIYDKEGVLK